MKLTKNFILALLDQDTQTSFETTYKGEPCTIAFEGQTMVFYHDAIRLQVATQDIELAEKFDEPMLIDGYIKMYGFLIGHKLMVDSVLHFDEFGELTQS